MLQIYKEKFGAGLNGQLRHLDLEKGLQVINFEKSLPQAPLKLEPGKKLLESEYFNIEYIFDLNNQTLYNDGNRFYLLTNLDGDTKLAYPNGTMDWSRGETIMLPAGLSQVTITGPVSFLKTYIP